MRLLGAAIGTFRAIVYELPVREDPAAVEAVRVASVDDLVSLRPLLAPGGDHRARILDGDICAWTGRPEDPTGLVWLNRFGHVDRHFGAWSDPSDGWAYLNQLVVAPDHRRKGTGTRLTRALQHLAARAGSRGIRTVVIADNSASHALFSRCGASPRARLMGLRLGGLGTLRIRLPMGARTSRRGDKER